MTKPAAARCSTTATGRTTSTFDADGRLSTVISPAGLRLTYAYDAASQRKYLIEPGGMLGSPIRSTPPVGPTL